MDKLYFLIDTNIFIQIEDQAIIKDSFNKFHRLCIENSAVILIHSLSREEIRKDKNSERKKAILSKIDKYTKLKNPPLADEQEISHLFGLVEKENDKTDCQFLYALYKHAVSFLVTEDIGIHKKAQKISLKQKVLTVNQANNMLERLFPKQNDFSFPTIQNLHLYNINFEDNIFDNLKEDYSSFQTWWEKCSTEQVQAWIVQSLNKLESICIYKEAKEEDYTNYNLPKKSLKLATFKVDESHRGKKLGELMLKQAFFYAIQNNFKACWITVFPKHKVLIDFIKDFGFEKVGKTNLKDKKTNEPELIFQKSFFKTKNCKLKSLNFHIKYFPVYDDSNNIGKHLIPIQEKYHNILFPEKKEQLSLFHTQEIQGNTIKKVYLCHASTTQLKSGDLLFFYVSSPIQAISSIGIIESVFRSNELFKVVSHIGKRSVYSFSEIEEMTKQKVLVIEFRFIKHLTKNIKLQELKKKKIITAHPQSIQILKNYEKFKNILSDLEN